MHLLSGRLSRFGQDDSDHYDRALQQMTPPVQPTLSSWTGPRPEGVPSVSTLIHSATVKHGRWEQAGLVMPAVSVEAVLRCMHQGQCCQYPRCPEPKLMHCQGGAWAVRCIVSEEDLKQKLTAKLWHSWIYGSAPPVAMVMHTLSAHSCISLMQNNAFNLRAEWPFHGILEEYGAATMRNCMPDAVCHRGEISLKAIRQ